MASQLDVPRETLEKLLRRAEEVNQTPAALLDLLLSEPDQRPAPQSEFSTDEVLHQWVLANISDTVFITRDDGTFTYVCPNIHIIFNYTDQEVWQFGTVQAFGLGNLYQAEELAAVGEIANLDVQITDKTGKNHYLLINIKHVNLGRGTVLYVCRDNTARREMELRYATELEAKVIERTAELRQKSEQVEAILNHSGDAIALVGSNGMIQEANLTFYRYFGHNSDEILFRTVTNQFDQEQASLLTSALETIFQNGQPQRMEILAMRRDGIPFDADVLMSPVYGDDGQVISIICSLRDITERKHYEVELRRALHHEQELNEVRSRFVSTLSHEYRTPLAIILSSSEILLRHSEAISFEQRHKRIETIRDQIHHMTGLMDDVVAISKTEVMSLDLRREVVDICTFCQTVVAEVQGSTTTHDLEFNMLEDCGTVLLDKKLMRQVIYNLLSNAIKYSPSGSTIYFDLECVASQISLRVRDQGIGIPADDLEQLFDVYYRAQNVGTIQGSGLGLPIIKRAVEAHGGKVSVESEVNRGTTFTVILPREPLAVPE